MRLLGQTRALALGALLEESGRQSGRSRHQPAASPARRVTSPPRLPARRVTSPPRLPARRLAVLARFAGPEVHVVGRVVPNRLVAAVRADGVLDAVAHLRERADDLGGDAG